MIDAESFAAAWIAGWNGRDLEAILGHYADSVVLRSPRAAVVVPESGGVISGKERLRDYWTVALGKAPDLSFTLDGVYEGVDTLVIAYRNQTGASVLEAMRFEDGLVVETWIAHGSGRRES